MEILESSEFKSTKRATLHSPYPDIPPVEVIVFSKEEMLANKISAICQRNRPRDVYDTVFLLGLGAPVNIDLINEKIPRFTKELLEKKLREKREKWRSLEPLIVTTLPAFDEQVRYILSFFHKSV